MTRPELMTSADTLAYVRNLLKDTKAEVELDWYNNDTAWDIEVYIHNGDWKHDHLRIKGIMIDNGFTLVDSNTTAEDGDTDDCYSATYWFN